MYINRHTTRHKILTQKWWRSCKIRSLHFLYAYMSCLFNYNVEQYLQTLSLARLNMSFLYFHFLSLLMHANMNGMLENCNFWIRWWNGKLKTDFEWIIFIEWKKYESLFLGRGSMVIEYHVQKILCKKISKMVWTPMATPMYGDIYKLRVNLDWRNFS